MLRPRFISWLLFIVLIKCYLCRRNYFFSRLRRKTNDVYRKSNTGKTKIFAQTEYLHRTYFDKSVRFLPLVSVYTALSNYEIDSTPVAEKRYRWIARVVHSRNNNYPHICTAVCIDTRIFITAAACISTLKVIQTSVIYQYGRLHAIAFVVPSNGSQQAFDDIGFIIVVKDKAIKWRTINLFDTVNRTDDHFEWFAQIFNSDEFEYKVVGYAVPKIIHHLVIPDKQFYLTELPVVVNINLCPSILTFNNLISGFYSPCYHSCSVPDYEIGAKSCASYHGVEGAAVFHVASNKLIGVATWGPTNMKPLPVGFAVPNSENFFEDYQCAKRIRDDGGDHTSGYQTLCDSNLF